MDGMEKFVALQKKVEDLSKTKIRMEERFKSEKEKLENLVKEIQGKGYDPNNLPAIKEKLEKTLKESLEKLDKEVTEITEKLSNLGDIS